MFIIVMLLFYSLIYKHKNFGQILQPKFYNYIFLMKIVQSVWFHWIEIAYLFSGHAGENGAFDQV